MDGRVLMNHNWTVCGIPVPLNSICIKTHLANVLEVSMSSILLTQCVNNHILMHSPQKTSVSYYDSSHCSHSYSFDEPAASEVKGMCANHLATEAP